MAIVSRSQIVMPGDKVRLSVTFRDLNGDPADTDSFPQITIVSPNGAIVVGPTSAGVSRTAVGEYEFIFDPGLSPVVGTWRDIWRGTVNGNVFVQEPSFTVFTSQVPAINSDGYIHLGDDPGFDYSQNAISNINVLLKQLRARLKSRGKHKTTDEFGNEVLADCDIYSNDELVTFLSVSLCEFNNTPMFTFFTFDDTDIIRHFCGILVQGATLMALSSQALIERGREFQITDQGISFVPPTISDMLSTQWGTELTAWRERVKMIKANMRSNPFGLGTLSFVTGASPQVRRLRFLRARRFFF